MLDIFDAVKVQWTEAGLLARIPNIRSGELPPGTIWPWSVFTPISDVPWVWTNKREHNSLRFQIKTYDTTLTKVTGHAEAIRDGIRFAQLQMDSGHDLLEIRPGPITFMQEDKQVWSVVNEFTAKWSQTVRSYKGV